MPRGARKDDAVTALLYKNGILQDRRSFVSLPNLTNGSIHLYLEGADRSDMRKRVYIRDKGKCRLRISPDCRYKVTLSFEECEMHHIQGGLVGRCDCKENLAIVCDNCHRMKHVRPKFSKNLQGVG